MGIKTVAVYSDADAQAKHVVMADQAVRLGPPPVAQSYLRADGIIAAALQSGAEAIHPGYGFLSENADFAQAVEAAGLAFIGPPASAIRAMGLKDAAKALMLEAGVPVVPGYHGADQDVAFLAGQADAIGYPVLIKARAGGGGKGMRKVDTPQDFKAALEGAQREAQASFGDPICLIEKFITAPRHVEIQVFADAHGNVVHLCERDCSLQRRHQKVIEEAPAPGMTEAVRSAMGTAAVEAARAIGYTGAGTVEFIADGSRGLRADGFWFMEMNTRLQVEHPVTEAVIGADLVEWQLRVAAGEALPVKQADIVPRGHAFEARLYAEDVSRGFLPAVGQITQLVLPDHAGAFDPFAKIRIDAGVRAGDVITPHYDPMIGKVIVHGRNRDAALRLLDAALTSCRVAGCQTNLEFLKALARHAGFANGAVDTGLIDRDLAALSGLPEPDARTIAVAALAALRLVGPPCDWPDERGWQDPWASQSGFRNWGVARHHVALGHAGGQISASVTILARDDVRVQIDGGRLDIALTLTAQDDGGLLVTSQGHTTHIHVAFSPSQVMVFTESGGHSFTIVDPLTAADQIEAGGDSVTAPMPGLVKVVCVGPGHSVSADDPLVVLEAMKMEYTLRAPRDGVVADVAFSPGDPVIEGVVLITLEPDST